MGAARSNTSSNDEDALQKYAVGVRNRFNMTVMIIPLAGPFA